MNLRLSLPILLLSCVGCSSPPPPPPPSQAEQLEYDQLQLNEEAASRLLDSGAIHSDQDVHEVLKLCRPYRVEFVGRYAFIEFYRVPNLHGLSLIAVDGQLVSARRWTCTHSHAWFETIGEDEQRAAWAAYEARLFGER